VRWNAKINLTSTQNEVGIIIRHFLDSLAAFKIFEPRAGIRILDIGTGAGFPGMVLKLQAPSLSVTLLEPAGKKAAFLHHMRGILGPSGLEVLMGRVEDLQDQQQYHVVTSRALKMSLLLSAAPRFLAPGGAVLLYGVKPIKAVPDGYRVDRQLSYRLPFLDIPRTLTLLRLRQDTSPSLLRKPLVLASS
jgi:16S rRNA (guanine527-N7)-methyltransferase